MKILHCVYTLNPEHGAPRDFIEQAAAQQSQHNFQIEVACLDQKTDPWLKKFGAPVHALGPGLLKYGYTKKWKTWLEKHHAKFDVVVINGLWHFSSFGTWLALRNEEKPYFVMPHNNLDSWYAYRYPAQHFKNLIYWNLAENRVLRDAKAVIFTSADECNQARKAFTPYEVNEAVVSAGTTAPAADEGGKQERAFYALYGGLQGKEILLFLGKLNERKGLENLLEAFASRSAEKPNVQLVIAGAAADNYGMKLQEIVGGFDEKIRERVTFTGNLNGDTKWGALRAAEALIVPAHQSAQARSVKEALSIGKPVLISSKMSIWTDVAQHEAGLVEDPDVEGDTKLLERWFDIKPAERKTMGTNAKALFLKKFEDTKFFPKYLSVLEGKTPAKPHSST